jgi:hypothetical protein
VLLPDLYIPALMIFPLSFNRQVDTYNFLMLSHHLTPFTAKGIMFYYALSYCIRHYKDLKCGYGKNSSASLIYRLNSLIEPKLRTV